MDPSDGPPNRKARIDALFDAALDAPREERQAFLDRWRDSDPELALEVRQLLEEAERPAPALENGSLLPIIMHASDGIEGVRPGLTIDAWRVVRLIGRGGMGSVFLVERHDGAFAQIAALKLVRPGLDSEHIVRRFERERQILASLNHPSIARLLDGGRTADGRPYFVMEHVEGRPIDGDCDARRLTIDERLAVFAQVCKAVQYAHAQLVVHRDVKPSNILVTPAGDVKLLDFGIAALLEPSRGAPRETTGAIAGILTPDYATPEHVRGEPVATSSDVYQLGLLLYELLTGARAQRVRGSSPAELERAICILEPPRPSECARSASERVCAARQLTPPALSRRLRGDLDTLIGVALRKEADRRYASVGDLLGDIERFSRGLPIRVRADSVTYRTRKFVSRHRIGFAFVAALMLTLVSVVPMMAIQRMRTVREQQRARQLEDVLGRLFAQPDPHVLPHAWSAADFVENATRLVRTELAAQPASQARLLMLLGQVDGWLGRYGTSIGVLNEAFGLQERQFGPDSREVAESCELLAQAHHYLGKYSEAERMLRRAVSIRRGRGGPDDVRTLDAILELGDLLHSRGELVEAESALRDAIARLRKLNAPDEMLARGLQYYANVLSDRGVDNEAAAAYRVAIARFLAAHAGRNQRVAVAELYYGRLLVRTHALVEAERLLPRAVQDLRVIYGGEHPVIVTALRELGYLRTEQGRLAEAAHLLDESQRIALIWLGPDHPMVARTAAHQAEVVRRQGRPAAAVAIADRALGLFARLNLSNHPAALDLRYTLGKALLALGQRDRARQVLEACVSDASRLYVAGDERIRMARQTLQHIMAAGP